MSQGYFGDRQKLYLEDLYWGLITSAHILHHRGIVDAYGHVSVRNPDDPSTFFMARNMAPALMSNVSDIVEYRIEDAQPTQKDAPNGFGERYIHSEILKKFPNVNAVIHAHTAPVLPFAVSSVPLRPTIHMAGFLGTEVPVWDITNAYSSADSTHDLLVRNPRIGASLAAAFRPSTSAGFVMGKLRSALPSQIGGSNAPDPMLEPTHPVVLMRGHGFTTCAASLEDAVFQAVYTVQAAEIQSAALNLHNAHSHTKLEGGKVDVQGSGKISGLKVSQDGGNIRYLSEREAGDSRDFNRASVDRPWALWCREVEVHPLYRNEVKREEKIKGSK